MSPILVRPVREQLEHDRVIRLLQAKYKRKFEVGINPGPSQASPVGNGDAVLYPDLVLVSPDKARKLQGVVEVETVESVNHLEAMAQWARLGRLRADLHLYVPAVSIDTTRRLCAEYAIPAAEIWTYHAVGDEIRFALIEQAVITHAPEPKAPAVKAASPKPAAKVGVLPVPAKTSSGGAKVAKKAAPAKPILKPAPKKPAPKKPAVRKPAPKKPATKKPVAKKPVAKKAPAKRAALTKSSARKSAAKSAGKPAARKR